ncbi:MAG TPA: hypothetical protein VL200_06535 [Lacunisphaera sp.]|jgi:hypothetical protein|nr:hypothetical protein [Lacunisphaera sp.]
MKLLIKPARHLVTRLARAYGFLDPVALLTQLRAFARESEVGEPIELLRAGMLFHARGLINTKAIQHNLDWVWPYWVERQFNPDDPSFIPRAFSFSHINLTHRNWTAVGRPDVPYYPIVDPRGLVTPLFDGWSLDFWVVPETGPPLFPSKLPYFDQQLRCDDNLVVRSVAAWDADELVSETELLVEDGAPVCRVRLRPGRMPRGFIGVALRPYNPEGISFVNQIEPLPGGAGWRVDGLQRVLFTPAPARQLFSNYLEGDVSLHLPAGPSAGAASCPAGMATAVALFPAADFARRPLEVRAPIFDELHPTRRPRAATEPGWAAALERLARFELPDPGLQRLCDLARACVVLHAPGEVYPGPYTYKRFWFRDAVFILHGLLTLGDVERVRRALGEFAPRQRRDGYFLSQEGEWDSNGEALWMFGRFAQLTGETLPATWQRAVARGARWIRRKRLPSDLGRAEAGLLPAGFSAEHLGPNDFYYWDDFWAVAGLAAAADLLAGHDDALATTARREAADLQATIERSIPSGPQRRFPGAIPASPYRRMDAGAIGSIVADYPLQLLPPGDERILRTAEYLRAHCFRRGVFMQDMIHSGLNIYLTLHLAQVWLRAGRPRLVWPLLKRVAQLASPTGQWPEAIHPRTGGGCMGDGQHIWAAAEWLMLLRNLCLREERDRLVVGAGVAPEWLALGPVGLTRTLTPHGAVGVRFTAAPRGVTVHIDAAWRGRAPALSLQVPGCAPLEVPPGDPRREFELAHAA